MRKNYSPVCYCRHLLLFCLLVGGLAWSSANAQYCLPTYNSQCSSGDFIDGFRFNTINQLGTGCANPGTNNYTDYSALVNTTVVSGNTYTVTCFAPPTFGQYFVMFIDLNKDMDFDDPGEFFDIGFAAGSDSVSAPVMIPCGVIGDTTRMRVLCRYNSAPLTQADVCAPALSFGEVEDYTIIIERPPINGSLAYFQSPITGCGLTPSEPVTMCVVNCGLDTIQPGGQICYRLNGGNYICETTPTAIAPLDTLCYTFSGNANLGAAGTYTLDGYISVTGDTTSGDDSLFAHTVDNVPVINTLPYAENFDTNNGGWTTEGSPTSWEWGVPNNVFITAAASTPNAWVTRLDSLYFSDENSFLISPCYDFSGVSIDPYILFSHIYNTDGFSDEGWLEVSTDAGANWSRLGTSATGYNWYNDTTNNAWDGNSTATFGNWRTAYHELTGVAGSGNVRLRFALSTDGFSNFEGFGVDNIGIVDTIWNSGASAVNAPGNGCQLTATEQVSIDITNYGTHSISNFMACYVVDGGAPNCEVVTTTVPAGSTFTYVFTGTADLSALGPHTVATYTQLSNDFLIDDDSSVVAITNYPLINTFPFLETFDSGPSLWTSGGVNNDWELGTPAKSTIIGAVSAPNAWVSGTLGAGSYRPSTDSWVESPCFDLSNVTDPWVASQVWWNSEFSWDGVVLEASTDGGNVWSEIGNVNDPNNWYTDSTINGLQAAGLRGHGWTGRASSSNGSNGYVQACHPLDSLAGQSTVRFRMHFGSDGSVQDDGFAFDNFGLGQLPVVDLGADTIVCSALTLSPNLAPGKFQWSTQDTTPTVTVTQSGMIVLNYISPIGLKGSDTINVTINPTPAVDLGLDKNVCIGDTYCISLDTTVYPNVNWSNSTTGGSLCITTAGSFSVQVTDTVGCPSADTVNTAIVQLPTPNLGPDTTSCAGDTICLDPGCPPTHSFVWSTGATTPIICTNINSGYWVICTDSNGCSAADSIFINPGPAAPAPVANFDTTACPTVTFSDMSTGTVSNWYWDFGDGNTSTLQNPSHTYSTAPPGNYTVTFAAGNQCAADTITFQVDVTCIVGISDGLDAQLDIFPNPNNGAFRIETVLTGAAPVKLDILNVQGQVVFSREYEDAAGSFTEEVNLEDQASGVYFVRFDVGGKISMQKLVIE